MNRIRAIKCCSHASHAVVVCHMAANAQSLKPIKHVRACQAKGNLQTPDTSPCRSKGSANTEECHA